MMRGERWLRFLGESKSRSKFMRVENQLRLTAVDYSY